MAIDKMQHIWTVPKHHSHFFFIASLAALMLLTSVVPVPTALASRALPEPFDNLCDDLQEPFDNLCDPFLIAGIGAAIAGGVGAFAVWRLKRHKEEPDEFIP
jgi:hypothetical protein